MDAQNVLLRLALVASILNLVVIFAKIMLATIAVDIFIKHLFECILLFSCSFYLIFMSSHLYLQQ